MTFLGALMTNELEPFSREAELKLDEIAEATRKLDEIVSHLQTRWRFLSSSHDQLIAMLSKLDFLPTGDGSGPGRDFRT